MSALPPDTDPRPHATGTDPLLPDTVLPDTVLPDAVLPDAVPPDPRPVLHDWQDDPWDDPAALSEVTLDRLRPPRSVPKVIGFFALLLLVVALLIAGGVGFWVVRQVNPSGKPGEKVNVTINTGETVDTLSHELEAAGIITNAKVFRWYVSHKGGLVLAPGYYTVKPRDTMGNILAVLRTPPAQTFEKVTFPEGFTVADMAKRLSAKVPRLSATEFERVANAGTVRSTKFQPDTITSLEGLLFPDTYQVAGNDTEEQVVKRMVDRMERVAVKEGLDQATPKLKASTSLDLTPYQVLVVASIIEKEAGVDADRPLIARVIYNRLLLGKPLEVDATLYYGHDTTTPFATLRDLVSPYNSYQNPGLPPTPISNPGAASIRAALNPAQNPDIGNCPGQKACEWLYYVLSAKNDRSHVFATNFEDHQKNVAAAKAAGVGG